MKAPSLLVWRDSQASGIARAAADQDRVYTLNRHVVYAMDKSTGRLVWSTPLTYPPDVNIGPQDGVWVGFAGGHVVVGDTDLFGLDPATGAIVWRFAPRTQFHGERTFQLLGADGSGVYCGGVTGNLYAVDAVSGAERWATHLVSASDTNVRVFSPVLANGTVYAAYVNDHGVSVSNAASTAGVAAVDANSGTLRWSVYLPNVKGGRQTSESDGVAVIGSRVVAAGGDGDVYALDAASGATIDTLPRTEFGMGDTTVAGATFTFAAQDTVLVIGATTNVELAVDARNIRRTLWNASKIFGSVSDVAIIGSRAYTTFFGGQLVATDVVTGNAIWWLGPFDFMPQGEYALFAPAVDSAHVYVGTDHNVYAFQKK